MGPGHLENFFQSSKYCDNIGRQRQNKSSNLFDISRNTIYNMTSFGFLATWQKLLKQKMKFSAHGIEFIGNTILKFNCYNKSHGLFLVLNGQSWNLEQEKTM